MIKGESIMSDVKVKYGISGIIAGICLAILIISGSFSLQSCRKNNSIKIGVIISLSGPGAHLKEVLEGIELSVEEINKYDGINGRKIELIVRDNKTNPEKAVEEFKDIEAKFKPDLYITALSSIGTSLSPYAEKAEVPLLCLVTSGIEITRNKNWVFRFYTLPENEITPILYFFEKLKIKNPGVIYLDDEYGKAVFAELEGNILDKKIKIDSMPYDRKNIKISDAALKILNNDAVYIIGYPVDYTEALIVLRKEGYKGYILAASGAAQQQVSELSEADGVYLASPAIYNEKYSFAAILKSNFEAKYNRPLSHYGANGYESLKMLSGLLSGKEISRGTIQEQMASGFVYTGSLGKISVKSGEHDLKFELMPAKNVGGIIDYE